MSPAVGYRVEAVAYVPGDGTLFHLGDGFDADPRLALRWLRGRACEIANHQADDAPGFTTSVHEWLNHQPTWSMYLRLLLRGLVISYADSTHDTVYEFSVRPVLAGGLRTGVTRTDA
ncbi:hypothetical protein [Streptomyces sp. B6B3]|uniref:hypothetical protein n=1 Tax=Streptomyces sp. B6B3 TaxID=3153570 RepID=UPI00325D7E32